MERGSRQSGNRAIAVFVNGRWHTDKCTQANVVLLSDAGFRDCPSRPSRKLHGTGFLLIDRDTPELLAAASFFTMVQAKQADINMLELIAVQTAIGLLVAVRAGKALEVARTCTHEFTRPELRTVKTKVCDSWCLSSIEWRRRVTHPGLMWSLLDNA